MKYLRERKMRAEKKLAGVIFDTFKITVRNALFQYLWYFLSAKTLNSHAV